MTWVLTGCIACGAGLAFTQTTPGSTETFHFGNFKPDDSDQLLQLAIVAIENNEFQSAEQSISDAMQIIKANHGLLSPQQFPALQVMAETLLAQQKWQALDKHLGYFEWLLRRLAATDIDAYLSGTDILNKLYLCAAADPNSTQNAHYLVAAKQLNWRVVSAVEHQSGRNSLSLAPHLYNLVLTHYYQSALIKRKGMTSYDYKSESPSIVSGWSLSKNESVQQSYRVGLELLRRIRALYANSEQASASTDSLMLMYLADWEWLFNRDSTALTYYKRAYTQLQAANMSSSELDAWFARPIIVPNPEFFTTWQPEPWTSETTLTFVAWTDVFPGVHLPETLAGKTTSVPERYSAVASLDLTPGSSATTDGAKPYDLYFAGQNLQIESVIPVNDMVAHQARNLISELRFRPVIFNSAENSWKNIRLNYVFSSELNISLLE